MKKSLVLTMTLALGLTGLTAGSSPASAEDPDVVLSRGHIDMFEVTFDPTSQLPLLLLKDDTELYAEGVVFRDPETVAIDVDAEHAAFEIPEDLDDQFDFLGAPGETVYMVPEIQDEDLPWPGWSTERLDSTVPAGTTLSTADDAVKLTLDIAGPGDVHTFMSGSFGDVVNHYVDTTDNLPDVLPVGTHNHVHTTWLFTEAGDYTISATPSIQTAGGTVLTGQEVDYRFHVGDPLAPITPVPVAPGPTILGVPAVGTQLFGSDGNWKPAPTEYVARQWKRDGNAIAAATQSEYVVQPADAGHALTFSSTVRIGRQTATATSAPVTVPGAALANVNKPTITAAPKVGTLLSASPGTWSTPNLSFTYQWLRAAAPIPSASKSTYRPTPADRGKPLSVRVTATKTGFTSATATSATRTVQLGAPLRASTKPRLTGKAKVGKTLKISAGRWVPTASAVAYQWRVSGKVVKGKTGPTFKIKRAHNGKKIVVTVIAKRAGYAAGTTKLSTGKVK